MLIDISQIKVPSIQHNAPRLDSNEIGKICPYRISWSTSPVTIGRISGSHSDYIDRLQEY